MAKSNIIIFVVSTYDTDYILVEASKIVEAKQALTAAGYVFEG